MSTTEKKAAPVPQRYVATQVVRVPRGSLVYLDEAQLERRADLVTKEGDHLHRTLVDTEFKVGEVFGYVGDLPKSIAEVATKEPEGAPRAPAVKRKVKKSPAAAKR